MHGFHLGVEDIFVKRRSQRTSTLNVRQTNAHVLCG